MEHSSLAYLRWVVGLTLTCAGFTGMAADKESADGLTAREILDKMATTYATCKSYRDSGVVTNDFGPHNTTDRYPRHIAIKPFRTAFVRPDQFRFEFDDATPDKPYIVWAKAGEVRTW